MQLLVLNKREGKVLKKKIKRVQLNMINDQHNFDWSAHSHHDRPKLLAHFYNALRISFFKSLTNKTNRLFF